MSELKPCPFCGGDEFKKIYDYSDIQGYTNVCFSCTKCGATSRYYYIESLSDKETVIKHWNTRPVEDAKDKDIERLKADNQVYRDMLNSLLNEEVYHLDNATMTNIKYELDNRGKDTNVHTKAQEEIATEREGEDEFECNDKIEEAEDDE